MEQNEFEQNAEKILKELKGLDGHSSVKKLPLWADNQPLFNSLKIRLAEYGLVKLGENGSVLTLTVKGWQFTTFQEERNQITEERRLRHEQMESIIDTNKSIQSINCTTKQFYEKQDRYLKTQRNLTWVIAIATAIYTLISLISLFSSRK